MWLWWLGGFSEEIGVVVLVGGGSSGESDVDRKMKGVR